MILDLLHRIAAHPAAYDAIQHSVGCHKVFTRLSRHFSHKQNRSVLDIGAGTGLLRSYLPANSRYIWLDSDPQKLGGFRNRRHTDPAILCDATRLALADHSIQDVLCVSMTHHIPDEIVADLFNEIARVAANRLIFLDPVLSESPTSRILWSLDRGSFPRTPSRLRELISERFEIEFTEEFRVVHKYFCCVATPRKTDSQ